MNIPKILICIGIFLILFMEISIIFGINFITTFATPVLWTGYILLIDGIIFILKKSSLILSRTREFLYILLLSFIFWMIFEWFNIFLSNWHYINLPCLGFRYFSYIWAFSTIMPAIFETTELIEVLKLFSNVSLKKVKISKNFLVISIITGLFFIFLPILCKSTDFLSSASDPDMFLFLNILKGKSQYMAGFVWLGFIFLLDPINYLLNKNSIIRDIENGRITKLLSLFLGGFVCGILWEFWNFWAYTKWYYTVPILSHIKIFEMPILGYFGFPFFAVELYVMYNFVASKPS